MTEIAENAAQLTVKVGGKTIILTPLGNRTDWYDFTDGQINGWCTYEPDKKVWYVNFSGEDRAWRQVIVPGKIQVKTAIKRAWPYALPTPVVIRGQFGQFVDLRRETKPIE